MNPSRQWEIRCRGRVLVVNEGAPIIAGILNVTPDSFFDGGQYTTLDRAVMKAGLMIDAGAAIIDIGGASSRPRGVAYGSGADVVPPELELARVLPVVKALTAELPEATLSIDTYHPSVAAACLDAGAHIINDITALRLHRETADVVARYEAALILMHSTGSPGQMPHVAEYADVLESVRADLEKAVEVAEAAGVGCVVTDPGFGFGKTTADNFRLINELEGHRVGTNPIMIGVSRKSAIGVSLGSEQFPAPSFQRLFGSLGATAVAAIRGAAIVRTHDVAPTAEMLRTMAITMRPEYAEEQQ